MRPLSLALPLLATIALSACGGKDTRPDAPPASSAAKAAAGDADKFALRPGREAQLIRSLLDTDIYKFLMQQLIWKRYRDVDVTFSLINRSNRIRLADDIDEGELRAQLDYARSLKLGDARTIGIITTQTSLFADLLSNLFHAPAQLALGNYSQW